MKDSVVLGDRDDDNTKHGTQLAKYARSLFKAWESKRASTFTLIYWDIPASTSDPSHRLTKKEAREQHFLDEIIDKPQHNTFYYGIILLNCEDGEQFDIRVPGLEEGYLSIIEHPSWLNDKFKADLEKATVEFKKRHVKTNKEVFHDLRSSVKDHESVGYWAEITVPKEYVGFVIGSKHYKLSSLESEFHVNIKLPEDSKFRIDGDSEEDVQECLNAIDSEVARVNRRPQAAQSIQATGDAEGVAMSTPATIASRIHKSRCPLSLEDIFKSGEAQFSEMLVLGSKNIVSYVIAATIRHCNGGIIKVILNAELMGLHSITTRGSTSSWVNSQDTSDLVNEMNKYCGEMVGARGQVSLEAMGFSKGNTSHNIHALLFKEDRLCVNEDIVKRGLCKVLQSARYFDPFRRERAPPVRSFYPYHRNVLCDGLVSECDGLSWSKTEIDILMAERDAAKDRLGIWDTYAGMTPPGPFIPRLPTDPGRRFVFVDNSNVWICAKNFSGEHAGSGFKRNLDYSERLHELAIEKHSGYYTKSNVILGIHDNPRVKNFVSDRRPYNKCDNFYRLDYLKLMKLIGYDRNKDPSFKVAGSIPPLNESVWSSMSELGSFNILSSRTQEGVASSEDTTLTCSIGKAVYELMNEEDSLILCGGDRGFVYQLTEARKKFPTMKIYVVSWAHAAYHRLKYMDDENTFFINLDPYIEYLRYSGKEQEELDADLSLCGEEDRVVKYPFDEQLRLRVKHFLTDELKLIEFRNFRFRSVRYKSYEKLLFVVFTNSAKENKTRLLADIPVPSASPRVQAVRRAGGRAAAAHNTTNMFAALDGSDVSDEEQSDDEFFDRVDEDASFVNGDC